MSNPQQNVSHPPFRPSPTRSATIGATTFKSRATSQPAGERSPAPLHLSGSQPDSGRGSPAGMFGVIGGSRTPKGGLGGRNVGGTATRANSFSAGEYRETRNSSKNRTLSSHLEHMEEHPSRSRSTSPFPTFSPSSSPSTSPSSHLPVPLPSSPPKAGANASRSRSQSLATGARPMGFGRGIGSAAWPMTTMDNQSALGRSFDPGWGDPVEGSNMSPFTRNMPTLGFQSGQTGGRFGVPPSGYPTRGFTTSSAAGWGTSAPEHPSSLSTSVTNVFGQPSPSNYSTIVGGFGESNYNAANGNKSGSSSRRHSVSVVGGPGGRRDMFSDGLGMGMTSPPGRGLGPLGFTDAELLSEQLGNALSLEIDQSRKRGVEIEVGRGKEIPQSASRLPRFDPSEDISGRGSNSHAFGSATNRPRAGTNRQSDRDQGEARPGSLQSRFNFEGTRMNGANGVGSSTRRPESNGPPGMFNGPGAIGAPPSFDTQHGGFGGGMYNARPPYAPSRQGPPSPVMPIQNSFGRPTFNPYGGPPRPPSQAFSPPAYGVNPNYGGLPPMPNQNQSYYPQGSPPQPTSPSFSQLSLSDLGRGIPLATLPPTTPLYIVTFKAGRRDVFYCADPTLLISNGDRVIVEADRGSDLGTVVYDQLTPIEVRDWQERQATVALLSGASQHQPPGMAVGGLGDIPMGQRVAAGELAGVDLPTLLAGVGGGQMDNPMGITTHGRGPLAKEIMPKRIFAKSSQGPEEQARMMEKLRDEQDALMICREKVIQRGLPMVIVDAEYQWDRRKLTFYFKADKRIDFRELTKENFRIFKSRIWMAMVAKDDPRGMA